jgi:DNA-binding transcriptional LysR family regulator
MELDGITVFVKVVQTASFSRAARLLGMPNTTVSAKVARLEKRLGVTLIQRTTRKLSVTPAGQAYFERCVRALEEIQAGESELATTAKEPQGLLKVTAAGDVAHSLLVPVVRRYLKEYPKTSVELVVTNRFVDLVAEGVDLAIRAGKLEDSTLIARKFSEVNGGLWASPAYLKRMGVPKHPKDLARHDCVMFSDFHDQKIQLSDGKEEIEVRMNGRIVADDLETIRALVLRGEGIGTLPEFLGCKHALGGALERVLPKWSWGGGVLSLVYPAQRFVSPKLQAFIALALATDSA